MTFDVARTDFVAEPFPLTGMYSGLSVVAPWWSDVDLTGGNYSISGLPQLVRGRPAVHVLGRPENIFFLLSPWKVNAVYYRSGAAASDVSRATRDFRTAFSSRADYRPFVPTSVTVISYFGVGSFPAQTGQLNTFQVRRAGGSFQNHTGTLQFSWPVAGHARN